MRTRTIGQQEPDGRIRSGGAYTESAKKPIKEKRRTGSYYTVNNPFRLPPFKRWARRHAIASHKILEPFAGGNNIVKMLREQDLCSSFCAYDREPLGADVRRRDTIRDFPSGYKTCITNPPWLSSYFAHRKGVRFPPSGYDNVYKHCLELALKNCDYVAFIIPATFIRTGLFRDRLESIVFITQKLFADTDHPVCLALFGKKQSRGVDVFQDAEFIGTLEDLEDHMPKPPKSGLRIRFNAKDGQIGLYAIDNTKKPTIRFCAGSEITRPIRASDRLITRIWVEKSVDIALLNRKLGRIRKKTHDVFFSTFKGVRKDGQYRRRIDYEFVRNLINESA